MTPREIAEKRRLIREGRYWESLGLLAGCSMKDIVIRIAELTHAVNDDRDFIALLHGVRSDFATGNYPLGRELCDEFFTRIGNRFSLSIIGENVITQEIVWWGRVHPNLSNEKTIKSQFAEVLRDLAHDLGERLQKDQERIDLDIVTQVIGRIVSALEIAQTYAADPTLIKHEVQQVQQLHTMVQCSRGIKKINETQKTLQGKVEMLLSSVRDHDPEYLRKNIQDAFDCAIREVREGMAEIEAARQREPRNAKVEEHLSGARKVLSNIQEERNKVGELVNNTAATYYCNRGIKRINEAQEKLKGAMDGLRSGGNVGALAEMLTVQELYGYDSGRRKFNSGTALDFFGTAISEIQAGIADIERAKQLDPHNAHISQQLDQARRILPMLSSLGKAPIPSYSSSRTRYYDPVGDTMRTLYLTGRVFKWLFIAGPIIAGLVLLITCGR